MDWRGLFPSVPAIPPIAVLAIGGQITSPAPPGENYLVINGNPGDAVGEVPGVVNTSTNLAIGFTSASLVRIVAQCYTADATTVLKLWKNGVVIATITLTGQYTIIDTDETFLIGDQIAISYNAIGGGTNPTYSTIYLYMRVTL
jgi:hypothetical protein